MITEYDFGRIVVNGEEYLGDLIILKEKVISKWWRKEGHTLLPQDLEEIIKEKPEILVVGTGASGYMQIAPQTKRFLEDHGIELIYEKTDRAVALFNGLREKRDTAGAFHLTC